MKLHTKKYFLFTLGLACFFVSCKTNKGTGSSTAVVANGKGISPEQEEKFKNIFYEGCKEKLKGNLEIAQQYFLDCYKINPQNAAVNYELGAIYKFSGLYDDALKHSKIASLNDSKNEWFQLQFIECLHNKRFYSEACEQYEKLVKQHPEKDDYYFDLAQEYSYAGKPDKALAIYDAYEKNFGYDEEIGIEKIKIYRKQNNFSNTEAELKKLISNYPNQANYYTFLAELYQENGKADKAYQTYQEILQRDPNNPYVHLALADYYRQQRKDDLFFKELNIAFESEELEIDQKIKILVSYYSVTEESTELKPQAYTLCNTLIRVHPNNAKAHSVYADFLYRDKKLAEAETEFEKVLELDKSKFAVWNQLLITESELNKTQELLEHSAEAIELFPNQAIPYLLNGVANIKLKNYKEAIISLKDAKEFVIENEPLMAQIASNLGEAYHYNKQYENSDKEFEEALSYDPDNILVMNNYAYYLSVRKQKLSTAEKYSSKVIAAYPNNASYLDTHAWVLFQEGKYTEAKSFLEKALNNGANNRATILEHYGDVLFKLGDASNALEYWGKAQKAGGNSAQLLKKINDKKWYE